MSSMGTVEAIVMVVAIVGGTLLLIGIVLGLVFGVSVLGIKGLVGDKTEEARQRYPNARLIDSRASFFGQESHGVTQLRGNGTLVITDSELVFMKWVPKTDYVIPLRSITGIETPTSFLGKTRFTPLLKVVFTDSNGKQDSMAWQVLDLDGVRHVIESGK